MSILLCSGVRSTATVRRHLLHAAQLLHTAPPDLPVVGIESTTSLVPSALELPALHDPVTMVINLLDALHTHTALPWWLTIAAYAGALRLATLPLTIQQIRAAEMNITLARLASATQTKQKDATLGKWATLRDRVGAPHPSWLLLGPCIQIPAIITSIMAVRSMCLDHWPGLAQGGMLFALDLTAPAMEWGGAGAPHGAMGVVLPVVFGMLVKHNLEQLFGLVASAQDHQGSWVKAALLGAQRRNWLGDVGSVVTLVGVPSLVAAGLLMPHGVLVYLVSSSSCNLVISRLMRLPAVRQYMGLQPLGQPPKWLPAVAPPTAAPQPPPGVACYDPEEAGRSAVDDAVAAFASSEVDVDSLFWKAAELRAQGKLADALHVVARIVQLQPGNARAHFAQGQMLSRAKRWAESQAAFATCAELEGDDFQRCRALLGTALAAKMCGNESAALGALGEAESMAEACVGHVPQAEELLVHVRMLRAAVLKGQGDAAGAARIVEDVVKANPKVVREIQQEVTAAQRDKS